MGRLCYSHKSRTSCNWNREIFFQHQWKLWINSNVKPLPQLNYKWLNHIGKWCKANLIFLTLLENMPLIDFKFSPRVATSIKVMCCQGTLETLQIDLEKCVINCKCFISRFMWKSYTFYTPVLSYKYFVIFQGKKSIQQLFLNLIRKSDDIIIWIYQVKDALESRSAFGSYKDMSIQFFLTCA